MTPENAQTIALKILQSNIQLPPFPPVGSQLMALNQQPLEAIDVDEFLRLVESDASLATRLLRLANSAYFSSAQKIANLRQAVMKIGLLESMNAVNWHFFQKTLPAFPTLKGFSGKDHWAHSWACAMANRMLGRPELMIRTLPGELYIAGLLHGIGKLILTIYQPTEFLQCLDVSRDFNQPLYEAELDCFGTTDNEVAYEILKSWQFPENICMAVKYYPTPQEAPPDFREIAAATQFAYYIANTSGVGNNGDLFCFDLKQTRLGALADSPLSNDDTRNRVVEEIYATLQKKYAAMGDGDGQQNAPSPPAVADRENPPARPPNTQKKPVPQRQGWLSRLWAIFRKVVN